MYICKLSRGFGEIITNISLKKRNRINVIKQSFHDWQVPVTLGKLVST